MYTQHFGLEKPVFDGGIAQHDDLFLGPRQQRVAANLKIGLTTRDSVVTLTGSLGVGKTTIAAQALRITSTRLAQTWVGNTPLAPEEMLELLLAGFELDPYDMGRVQRLHTWRQFVGEMSATDTRVCILVENALALGREGLQTLEALTAADPNDCPGANLVLMGSAELKELLDEPGLAPLKQRIRSNQKLDPMTPEEVEQYLRHRVTYAGGDYDKMFAPGAVAMMHCFSAGIPRVINNVCETALIVAATRKAAQLTPDTVQRVAETVYKLAPSGQLPEAAAASAPQAAPAAADEQSAAEPVLPAEAAPEVAPPAAVEPPAEEPAPSVGPATGEPKAAPVEAVQVPVEAATPAPAAAAVAAAKQPVEEPAPAGKAQAPVEAAAPMSAAVQTTEESAPPSEPAPRAETEASADDVDAELLEALLASDPDDAAERPPEPPVLQETPADSPVAASTPAAVASPSDLPILTDEVDIELPAERQDAASPAQPAVATLPPDAPKLPAEEQKADDKFTEDFAAATHLHEISDEMAEMLFSADPAASATGVFEAPAPLDSSDLELKPERTAVVNKLDEETAPENDENRDGAAASTLVF